MRALIEKIPQAPSPESLIECLGAEQGRVLLRSSLHRSDHGRYSFVAVRPFLVFCSSASRCELRWARGSHLEFGDPWRVLESLISRYELRDEVDLPFPMGGCFGYWGYDLKNFLEPRLPRRAVDDLEFPECHLGFYDSLIAFDHHLGACWIIATGLEPDGSRSQAAAQRQQAFWTERLSRCAGASPQRAGESGLPRATGLTPGDLAHSWLGVLADHSQVGQPLSNLTREQFLARVQTAQNYIRAGDIYQVNLSHRLTIGAGWTGWEMFQALTAASPTPFSAFLDCADFQVASSSPELFLRMSGSRVETRPIKGTRPRSADPTCDSQLSYQLRTSPKEMAELVMITDLLRNDLGKVCEFGSVLVPELARLERFAQVQHLVSTVEGVLRGGVTHLGALAACFPGGSITGAPKVRAMEIIEELEPVRRGPYTGALGYIGFNRESQLSVLIRAALLKQGSAHFQVGAGIVADSQPDAEYVETLDKARGFVQALTFCQRAHDRLSQRPLRS